MYHLFSTGSGDLLDHTLLGAPLGGHWTGALADGGVFGPQGLVYLGLFALVAAVATWNFRRARAMVAKAPQPAAGNAAVPGMASMAKVMPLLSFGTLITVAVVPLAAGLYMVTTTAWTACERALLHRDRGGRGAVEVGADGGSAADGKPGTDGKPGAGGGSGAGGESGGCAPGQRPAPQRADRRAPKSRAARQRAARARANSQSRSRADSRANSETLPRGDSRATSHPATTPGKNPARSSP